MIAEIRQRLADVGALKLIGGAAEFQTAADGNPKAVPAAYVLPMDETPGDRPFSGDDIQQIDIAVAVVLVLKNVAEPKGGAAVDDLQALRDEVKIALLGWVPITGYASLSRGRSNLLAFRDGYLWWQDTYVSSFYERKP